ncbi:hypothetical protein Pyrde_0365 [Pyrodictium delaneyi]|uniref:Uncharacterized protein n=1 Tax=Pyrodictium delaneyi TaxID=1273541 RepID=A0A0P0N1V8_9CREN|nr:hypothetical protein Pyrde_0365 [Pyrodictium delaneyi]OWJ53893.1 hypothetical protein Pdsh_08355 [Pyrodictium delaneyi]
MYTLRDLLWHVWSIVTIIIPYYYSSMGSLLQFQVALLGLVLGAVIGAWLVANGKQRLLVCIFDVLFTLLGVQWLYLFLSGEGSWIKFVVSVLLLYYSLPRTAMIVGGRCPAKDVTIEE